MTTEQKIIRAKVGLLELAKQLGNVSMSISLQNRSAASRMTSPPCLRKECWASEKCQQLPFRSHPANGNRTATRNPPRGEQTRSSDPP
jgi:hypothetical protein